MVGRATSVVFGRFPGTPTNVCSKSSADTSNNPVAQRYQRYYNDPIDSEFESCQLGVRMKTGGICGESRLIYMLRIEPPQPMTTLKCHTLHSHSQTQQHAPHIPYADGIYTHFCEVVATTNTRGVDCDRATLRVCVCVCV